MLTLIIVLLTLTAVLGLYLLSFVIQNKDTPKGIAFIHGPLAFITLLLLIIYCLLYVKAPVMSTIIFILAAIVGFVLIFRDLTGRTLPKWLAITHGLLAMLGFICLLVFTFFYR